MGASVSAPTISVRKEVDSLLGLHIVAKQQLCSIPRCFSIITHDLGAVVMAARVDAYEQAWMARR
ncbi:hypothetical protein SAMN05216525_104256 [Bradyrhizobium sp. Gha]|nr:hypothetical protein SAMN05216525_104256 [Bradyrhizobium sp. Gha]